MSLLYLNTTQILESDILDYGIFFRNYRSVPALLSASVLLFSVVVQRGWVINLPF
jgi:hypothetical protein